MSIAELRKLPRTEKLKIIETLWDDLAVDEESFPSPACESGHRFCDRVVHGHGLHAQSAHLHRVVRGTGALIRPGSASVDLEGLFCCGLYIAQYSRRKDFGAD